MSILPKTVLVIVQAKTETASDYRACLSFHRLPCLTLNTTSSAQSEREPRKKSS